jgi:hypothetical protein
MRLSTRVVMAAVAVACLGTAALVQAEDFGYASNAITRLDALETEVRQLREQLGGGGGEHDVDCDSCGHATGGWIGGVELTVVQPFFEDARNPSTNLAGLVGLLGGAGMSSSASFGMDAAPRFWIGKQNCNGFGGRVRYWQYDQSAGPVTSPLGIPAVTETVLAGLEVHALDVEMTQVINWDNWVFTLSGGGRYGSVHLTDIASFAAPGPVAVNTLTSQRFDGGGPTVSFEGKRYLGNSNLALFANTRASLLYGNVKRQAAIAIVDPQNVTGLGLDGVTAATGSRGNDLLTVLELQVGAEWSREIRYGAVFFARSAVEAQVWQGAGGFDGILGGLAVTDAILPPGGEIASTRGDLGFIGAAFAVGIAR